MAMEFFQADYIGVDIDDNSEIMRWTSISIGTTALLIQCAIGIMAFVKIRENGNSGMKLNVLFAFSVCCACLATLSWVMLHFKVMEDNDARALVRLIVFSIHFVTFGSFYFSLLATFILRLYLTFKDSVFRVSPILVFILSAMLLTMFVALLVVVALLFFLNESEWLLACNTVGLPMLCLYLVCCVLSVYLFISDLYKMIKARERTLRASTVIQVDDIRLDNSQQKFSDLAAKFMMLFGIAMTSSIFIFSVTLIVNQYTVDDFSDIRGCLGAIDLSVNLFAIYLQFAFAKDHYQRCCGCCDAKFRNFISKKTQNVIYKHCVDLMDRRFMSATIDLCSVPSVTPDTRMSESSNDGAKDDADFLAGSNRAETVLK